MPEAKQSPNVEDVFVLEEVVIPFCFVIPVFVVICDEEGYVLQDLQQLVPGSIEYLDEFAECERSHQPKMVL